MYRLNTQAMSPDFLECWRAAGEHLGKRGVDAWLRSHPHPPFLEHLSFRLGNQLFFIRVQDAAAKLEGPGSVKGLFDVANQANGHPCLLPMRKKLFGRAWVAENPDWGLLEATTRTTISPPAMVTDAKVEMTPWEQHDMAVQVVRDYLRQRNFKLMSWQSNPDVDPAIWFVGPSGPEWVVVRPARFPERYAAKPANWPQIANQCAALSRTGHFASVSFASTEQGFQRADELSAPLWRGEGIHVRFEGLG